MCNADGLIAHDRCSIAESVKRLANVAITKDGISEWSGVGIATGARVFDTHSNIVATLTGVQLGWSSSNKAGEKADDEGLGRNHDGIENNLRLRLDMY